MKNRLFGELDLCDLPNSRVSSLNQIMQIRNSIATEGLSCDKYDKLNKVTGDYFACLPRTKLTVNPSKTYARELIEIIDTQGFVENFKKNSLVQYVSNIIKWIWNCIRRLFSKDESNANKETIKNGIRRFNGIAKEIAGRRDILEEIINGPEYSKKINRFSKGLIRNGVSIQTTNLLVSALEKRDVNITPQILAVARYVVKHKCDTNKIRILIKNLSNDSSRGQYPILSIMLTTPKLIKSSVLLADYCNLDSVLLEHQKKVISTVQSAIEKINTKLSNRQDVSSWLVGIEQTIEDTEKKINSSSVMRNLIDDMDTNQRFIDDVEHISNGYISNWYGTDDSTTYIDPNRHTKTLASLVRDKTKATDYISSIDKIVVDYSKLNDKLSKVDVIRISDMLGNYNSASARFRGIISNLKKCLFNVYRVLSLYQKYIDGCVDFYDNVIYGERQYKNSCTVFGA